MGLGALITYGNRRRPPVSADARASRWLPYVPLLLAAVLCAPVLIAGVGPVYVAAAVAVAALLMRQFLVVGENRRLRAEMSGQRRAVGPARRPC